MVQQTKSISLSEATSRGALWFTLQGFFLKLVSVVAQVVLAKLLLEEEFGYYGLDLTVHTVGRVVDVSARYLE